MTEEQHEHIFDLPLQAYPRPPAATAGTGRGLAITRSFCRLMEGEVSVRSAPGNGRRFHHAACLSHLEALKEPPHRQHESPLSLSAVTVATVLMIEDNARPARDDPAQTGTTSASK